MKWKDITTSYKFKDGSTVIQRHQTHLYDCFEVIYNNKSLIASKDHILKINISNFPKQAQKEVAAWCRGKIPRTEDVRIEILSYVTEEEKQVIKSYITGEIQSGDFTVEDISNNTQECYFFTFPNHVFSVEVFVVRTPLEYDDQRIDKYNYWIPIQGLYYLYTKYGKLDIITSIKSVGKKECFCVSTDTGQYELNGLIHHNSVTVQTIIIHAIEHWDEVAVGLVDPKQVEFSTYKNMKGIVGVANSVQETVELLRIGRSVMYKRNKDLAALGCKQVSEYTPHEYSGKVFVCGREYNDSDIINYRHVEEKSLSAGDLADDLQDGKEVEVCINGNDWIPANKNCIHKIYTDTMQMLLFIIDEMAELTMKSGLKSEEAKREDSMKDEIVSIISSIAQLGRSAAVHVLVATQKPNASVIPTILRSNLGLRIFMGTAAETGASLVTLDNTLATTIDSTYPGMGIMQVNAQPVFFRSYFSKFEDLYDYYKKRGLDELGYGPNDNSVTETTETLSGTEEIEVPEESVTFEFDHESAKIDKREDQVWEEI